MTTVGACSSRPGAASLVGEREHLVLGRAPSGKKRPAQRALQASEHLEPLGRAPSEDAHSSALTRRRSPPVPPRCGRPRTQRHFADLLRKTAEASSLRMLAAKAQPLRVRGETRERATISVAPAATTCPGSDRAQPRNNPTARPRPASPPPLSSSTPSLATSCKLAPAQPGTTTVGACSSCDDRRSEPYRRASIWNSWAERRAEKRDRRSEPRRRASIWFLGRAPSECCPHASALRAAGLPQTHARAAKAQPCACVGETRERATDSVAPAATTCQVEPMPSSQPPLSAPPPNLATTS